MSDLIPHPSSLIPRAAPPALSKHGITTITDNRNGREVNYAADFVFFFRDELVARFVRPAVVGPGPCPAPISSGSGSK
jgi:hypothetical protein